MTAWLFVVLSAAFYLCVGTGVRATTCTWQLDHSKIHNDGWVRFCLASQRTIGFDIHGNPTAYYACQDQNQVVGDFSVRNPGEVRQFQPCAKHGHGWAGSGTCRNGNVWAICPCENDLSDDCVVPDGKSCRGYSSQDGCTYDYGSTTPPKFFEVLYRHIK
ncbi:unnamed protein product [Parajaminaea phylloscopi]